MKVSQGLPDWKAYVDFINSIIVSGLVDVTVVSLEQLECNLNEDYITKNNFSPLLEIDLDLLDKNVIYKPMVRLCTGRQPSAGGGTPCDPVPP